MIAGLKELFRELRGSPLISPPVVLSFMVTVQLLWWLIYYEMDHEKMDHIRKERDSVYLELARQGITTIPVPEYIIPKFSSLPATDYEIHPGELYSRKVEHYRRLGMLVSETLFVIIVILIGHRLIMRSIRKERKLLRERDLFINSVTHELKTPLALVLLNIQTILRRKPAEKDRTSLLAESVEHIRRLEDQINNILFARELGNYIENSSGERTDIKSAVKEWIHSNDILLKKEKVKIEISITEGLTTGLRKELFYKIIDNILTNAVHYSPGNPRIEIRSSVCPVSPGQVMISFRDFGAGIPREELGNIFKPFYRLENDARIIRGSGLGLYMVKEILDQAGGSVRALSDGPGEGSVFEVCLPD